MSGFWRTASLPGAVRAGRFGTLSTPSLARGGYDVVLDNGIGQPLSPWTVSADFRRVVHELGLPRTRFHDLRHAHATALLADGVHVKAVSERLGHASTSFTMDVYSSVIPSMGRTAADAAERLFGEGGER